MGHWVNFTWAGLDLTAEVNYTPGDPGRVVGPPENCYPPEAPEIEFISLDYGAYDAMWLLDSPRLCEQLETAALEKLEEDLSDEGPEYEPEPPADEPDFDDDIPY